MTGTVNLLTEQIGRKIPVVLSTVLYNITNGSNCIFHEVVKWVMKSRDVSHKMLKYANFR